MHDFQFHTPTWLDEALELLDRYGEDARPIAGGTALVIMMKQRLAQPSHLVSLMGIPALQGIMERPDGLHLGATSSQRSVETSPVVREGWPLLAETYREVATVRIRNQGTVGGGLANGDPNQDPPPSLFVLDARVRLASSKGERWLAVSDLFRGYYETAIEPGEVLTEVFVPPLPERTGTAYLKFLPRTADDYATVSAAALVQIDEQGLCREVRLALGSVGPRPMRARAAEAVLRGKPPLPLLLQEAAVKVCEEVTPLTDYRGSEDYKQEMASVFARRALERAVARAQL